MCQFNLVFVNNISNKKLLEENGYVYFGININNYFPYVKGCCNCGSFVGSMTEYDGNSFLEMIESSNKTELQRLNKIKNFMNKPDYSKLKEEYVKNRDSLSKALSKLTEPVSNYEMEQLDILENKYKGKELHKHIELLYADIDRKLNEIENSSEFKSVQTQLNIFIEKNKLMDESTCYYLTKEDEDQDCELISSDVILEPDDLIEVIDEFPEDICLPEEDSMVIDTVIKKLENKYENCSKDFLEYKQLFEKLLENEEYILFSCIWDEPGKMSIEKEVNIKNITIEDLASLNFDTMLKIYK